MQFIQKSMDTYLKILKNIYYKYIYLLYIMSIQYIIMIIQIIVSTGNIDIYPCFD